MPSTTRPAPCPHCGAMRQPLTVSIGGREVQAGFRPCPCEGARAEREAWEEAERAREREREARRMGRRLDRAGIPARYRDAAHPRARALAARAEAGEGTYLHGPNGSGKTHLACAAALDCLRRGMDVRFATVPSLLESIRTRRPEAGELVAALSRCDLLVLDDLGKEAASTAYAAERLFDVVNERYNSMLPLIVTSNYPRGQVATRISEGDAGLAIASRLAEMTGSVRIDGADRRIHG